jgi:hypothetical protein
MQLQVLILGYTLQAVHTFNVQLLNCIHNYKDMYVTY